MDAHARLSRRERQIMDVVYACGGATANQVLAGLPDAPSKTAVRTLLRILEQKGHLKHREQGREFVYQPTRPRTQAGRSAIRRVLDVFFDGSLEKAVAAHLSDPTTALPDQERKRLRSLIDHAGKKGGAE